jgi:hypothetical protein
MRDDFRHLWTGPALGKYKPEESAELDSSEPIQPKPDFPELLARSIIG